MAVVEQESGEMSNSARRACLCRQHESLRKRVDATRSAAFAALAGGEDTTQLACAIAALEAELTLHLQSEEALLGPILGAIDAWGPVRLERLRTEHRQQRAFFLVLTDPSSGIETIARRTMAFCGELLDDMDFEERELFGENVLRDDCVTLDASDA